MTRHYLRLVDPALGQRFFPVLADGLFTHTTAFTAPQTVQIKLPDNVTCTHCTLQVIQFMSNQTPNPTGGCFYHHCADLAIQTGAVPDGGLVSSPPDMSAQTRTSIRAGGVRWKWG